MPSLANYRIVNVSHETHNTFSWQLTPWSGEIFDFTPGQFVMLHLLNPDGTSQAKKPYSIASSPLNKKYLELAIKVQGNFSGQLATLRTEDLVGVEGPFGAFTYQPQKHKQVVMLAGGIGITPFISMIRYLSDAALEDNKIWLYYCNQTEAEIAYRRELEELGRQNPNLTVTFSVDRCLIEGCPGWYGEVGFIDSSKIEEHIGDYKDKYFFLCGPPAFIQIAEGIIKNHNVPSEMIKKEGF